MDFDFRFLFLPLLAPLLSVAGFAPIVLYIVARWRAQKEATPDPQLGLKFAIYYFATLALHVALAGLTLLVYTMIRPGGDDSHDHKGEMYRMAFGFIVPAVVVLAAHIALLLRTNDQQQPGIRRLFMGMNLLVIGVAGFAALVAGVQALFAKGSTDGLGHFGGAAILVYCTAWGLLAWRFDNVVVGPRAPFGMTGGPPANIIPPTGAPPPVVPPAATGTTGGLPPLGGGAFPPLDPPR